METRGALGEALAKLASAMQAPAGTVDPDKRRAAAKLAELARAEDADLAAFARRHLPGRAVDPESLRPARELLLGLDRLLDLQGKVPEAAGALVALHGAVEARLAEVTRALAEADAGEPSPRATLPTPFRPEQVSVGNPPWRASPKVDARHGLDPRVPLAPPSVAPPPATLVDEDDPPTVDGPIAPPSSAMPFVEARAPLLPELPAPPPDLPSRAPPHDPLSATLPPETAPHAERRGSLPFVTATGGASRPWPAESFGSAGGAPPGAQPRDAGGPSAGALPAHLEVISLETHATLTAALTAYPHHQAELFEQYGLRDAAERAALDRHWLQKLASDPALRATWLAARDEAAVYYRSAQG